MTAELNETRRGWRDRYMMYGALLVSWVAMLGSLYFSEVRHFVPCQLCWYQRILMYPLALGILPLGLLTRDEKVPYYSAFFAGIGMLVSSYHYLLQKTTLFLSGSVCAGGVPCNIAYINWLDFITIPFLALIAFILIFIASIIAITAREPLWAHDEAERAPWLPVLGIILLVAAIFAPSFMGNQPAPAEESTLRTAPVAASLPLDADGS